MSQNQSLSTQEVADILHVSRSTIYDLIRRGEIRSYKIGRKVRFTQADVDAYIARSRHEHSTQPVQKVDIHSSLLTPEAQDSPGLIISGQDVLLDILSGFLRQEGVFTSRSYLSSFESLLALYQDRVHIAACHLYSVLTDEYNTPFVRYLMPGVSAVLINLSYRTQGFYVKKGNPKGIQGWEDLMREDISILNRRVGSSARILLDEQLQKLGISSSHLRGYHREMNSHLTIAAAIAEGEADAAIGTERVCRQVGGIDFIPLHEERFDLVMKKAILADPGVQKLLEILNSPAFRREIGLFSGNDHRDLGRVMEEV